MVDISATRAGAVRVARWLVNKGRPDEAVCLLGAWAANGPNDPEGQELLAEALRIDPSARVAQQAFEKMEAIVGDHAELQACIERYSEQEVQRLQKEMERPTFRRAQMGFNNNIKSHNQVFHVQTEDSGLDQPHIVTQLFADGGRVIKSYKRSYAGEVSKPNVGEIVKQWMKAQHLEMVLALREGRFDEVIAGRALGGVEVLAQPPRVGNLRQLATQKRRADTPSGEKTGVSELRPADAEAPSASGARQRSPFTLHVLRSLSGGPERYEAQGEVTVIGSSGEISLLGERFCHPREALLRFHAGRLWLQDEEGGNGVFLRIRTPVALEFTDEFVVGDQLLRVERNPVADDAPDPEPTYFYSSPKWPSSFRLDQVFEGGGLGCCVVARGNTLQIGAAIGDLVFPDDPLVAEQHCLIEEHAGIVVLTDLGSRTGVFVRVRGEQELSQGDELLIGRTRLLVELGEQRPD